MRTSIKFWGVSGLLLVAALKMNAQTTTGLEGVLAASPYGITATNCTPPAPGGAGYTGLISASSTMDGSILCNPGIAWKSSFGVNILGIWSPGITWGPSINLSATSNGQSMEIDGRGVPMQQMYYQINGDGDPLYNSYYLADDTASDPAIMLDALGHSIELTDDITTASYAKVNFGSNSWR